MPLFHLASHILFIHSVGRSFQSQKGSLGYYKPLSYDLLDSPSWSNGIRYLYKNKQGRWFISEKAGAETNRKLITDEASYSPFDVQLKWNAWNGTHFLHDAGLTVESVDLKTGMF